MLNATSDNYMPIVVEGHDMHVIAVDSVNFPEPVLRPARSSKQKSVLLLASNTADSGQAPVPPGGRVEFLIKGADQPGIYKIVQLEQTQQFMLSDQKVIAEIEIKGDRKNMALPTKLPVQRRYYPRIKDEEVTRVRNFQFCGISLPRKIYTSAWTSRSTTTPMENWTWPRSWPSIRWKNGGCK